VREFAVVVGEGNGRKQKDGIGLLILISTYWCTTRRALLFSVSIFAEDVYIHAYIHTQLPTRVAASKQSFGYGQFHSTVSPDKVSTVLRVT
jgi:hypothetical protein